MQTVMLRVLGDFGFFPPFLNKPNVNMCILYYSGFSWRVKSSPLLLQSSVEQLLPGHRSSTDTASQKQEANRLVINLSVMPLCQGDG